MKTINFIAKDVKLISDSENKGESFASLQLNPNVTWMKFVFTDDKPNANGERVPKEEFPNIIKTGVNMPVKLVEDAGNQVERGHASSKPLGVITHLIDRGNYIEALAALWNRERPEDVSFIKEQFNQGQPVNVSWELTYDATASIDEGNKITALHDISVNAITIVDLPAFMGRTPVTAVAENTESEGDEDKMENITREDHEKIVNGLTEKVNDLTAQLEEKVQKLEELQTSKSELEELKPKYEELLSFKAKIEEKEAKAEKLATIRTKFEEAGIKVSDEFIESREAVLLDMSEASLDFYVQDLVAFAKASDDDDDSDSDEEESEAGLKVLGSPLPDLRRKTDEDEVTAADIIEFLRKE